MNKSKIYLFNLIRYVRNKNKIINQDIKFISEINSGSVTNKSNCVENNKISNNQNVQINRFSFQLEDLENLATNKLTSNGSSSVKNNRKNNNTFRIRKLSNYTEMKSNNSLEVKIEDIIKVIDNFDVKTHHKMQLLINIEKNIADSSSCMVSFFATLDMINNLEEFQISFEKMKQYFLMIKKLTFTMIK